MIKVATGTIPNIAGLKDAINKKWNIDSVPYDSKIPQMYVQDVENNYVPVNNIPQNQRNVKPSRTVSELQKYLYGLLDRVSGHSKFKNIESAINRIENGDGKYKDIELFMPGNDAAREAFYKATDIKLPEDEHGTVLQLLFLNEKFAIHKDFPTFFFGKYYGTKSNSIDLSLSELYNEYISTLKDADTSKNAPEHIKTRNERLEGKQHPKTKVLFKKKIISESGREYEVVGPAFGTKCYASLKKDMYLWSDRRQATECYRQLFEQVKKDDILKHEFTEKEWNYLLNGKRLKDYTWHHCEEPGKMQLVPTQIHQETGHTGGRFIWGGGNKYR